MGASCGRRCRTEAAAADARLAEAKAEAEKEEHVARATMIHIRFILFRLGIALDRDLDGMPPELRERIFLAVWRVGRWEPEGGHRVERLLDAGFGRHREVPREADAAAGAGAARRRPRPRRAR